MMRSWRILTSAMAVTSWVLFPFVVASVPTFPKWNLILNILASLVALVFWVYPHRKIESTDDALDVLFGRRQRIKVPETIQMEMIVLAAKGKVVIYTVNGEAWARRVKN